MRGAPSDSVAREGDAGIIPAYAGSTLSYYMESKGVRDHPRVCGEHVVLAK